VRLGPQCGVGESVSATTAIRVKDVLPSESAFTSATRSAQIVRPYDAFSMLQPAMMVPSLASSAAPTARRC
jgi:hypothetical protein